MPPALFAAELVRPALANAFRAAASGSGLDPDISESAARFQMERVAVARVAAILDAAAFSPGGPLAPERIVNVLELNLALDRML